MLRTFLSYKYVTIDLIKMISLLFLWILILSPNITRINVKDVNFCWNLSILPMHNDTILLFNRTFKSCLFVCTFLSLYEPFLLFFAIDKTFLSHFPNRNTFNMCLFFKLHGTCFLIFKYTIISVIIIVYSFLSIPCATLWYFQLVINLSNDISKNPGPQFQNNFFNFMSWNLNSLAKYYFQRVSLIEAHNSLLNYGLISICETCLNDSVELAETLLEEYTFVPANNSANTRRGGWAFFIKILFPL